jgi:hypothetical protein
MGSTCKITVEIDGEIFTSKKQIPVSEDISPEGYWRTSEAVALEQEYHIKKMIQPILREFNKDASLLRG